MPNELRDTCCIFAPVTGRPVQSKTELCVEILSPVKSRCKKLSRREGGTIRHTFETSSKDPLYKLHNTVELPALLYGCEE